MNACLHTLFERQADRTPEAVAVVAGDDTLTYQDLEREANRLARFLTRHGVGPDTVVGLCLERSTELVVGMLGILKAGGAHLPIDPEMTPVERVNLMLADAGARLVLTRQRHADGLTAPKVLCFDSDRHSIDGEPIDRRNAEVVPGSLAYVIYTSGSSGAPKGVMVEHRSIVNQVTWLTSTVLRGGPVRFLQAISIGFDAATEDFYAPLTTGGTVIMAPPDFTSNGRCLRELLVAQRVDAVAFTPPVLSALLAEGVFDGTRIRWMLCGGDVLRDDLVDRCRAVLPEVEIHNVYGPTETTVNATSFALGRARPSATVPIGGPIRNVRTYVVDETMELVPPGGQGELLIGGAGVARGYMGCPGLTADRFLPDPFSGEWGARLYRTGDMVRRGEAGVLEFVGRIDRQVKIRGLRVEPGEVEDALTRLPGITEAAVIAHRERLVAYITSDGLRMPPEEVRGALANRLPDHMLPATVVEVDALPRIEGIGKIDYRALPDLDGATLTTGTAPRDRVEAEIVALVAEVLQVPDVGVDDGFLDLGGHSLLAMRLAACIRDTFGVETTARTILRHSRIADLAAVVRAGGDNPAVASVPPGDGEGPVPLTSAQERLWFLEQLRPDSVAYNLPAVVQLRGPLDVAALRAALSGVVARHEVLRTVFTTNEGAPYQEVRDTVEVPLPVTNVRGLDADGLRRRVDAMVRVPFDLARGPLLRAELLRVDADEHILVFVVHHIVFDSWSLRILVEELAALYDDADAPSPRLRIQCADHAIWERRRLDSGALGQEVGYWRDRLAEAPPLLLLPTDRPRPPIQSFRGGNEDITLSDDLMARLRELCHGQGLTLFMVLLAGFHLLLSRYTGQTDVVVGTPVSQRTRTELEPLIGFFVNTLALRADLSGDPTVREFLDRVREWSLDDYTHQDLPFDRLVEDLQPERDLSHTPLFQSMFAFESLPAPSARGGGITFDSVNFPVDTARFDLTLDLKEKDGQVRGVLNYCTDLFDAATIRRMAGHYLRLLDAMTTGLDTPLSGLDMLSPTEREQLLVTGNGEGLDWPENTCVHELFEQQVDRTPDNVAVVCGPRSLTFRELEEQANRLAWWLVERGAGPETVVALCLDRSVDLLVGILGALKAGAAYLPLDPEQPITRLGFMLEDAGAVAVVTQYRHAGRLPEALPAVCLDDGPADPLGAYSTERPGRRCTVDGLLYVIYTSGSTGTPKGVAMAHRPITRMFFALGRLLGRDLEPPRRVTLNAPVFFDGSVQQFGWMFRGATLVVVPDEVRQDPDRFVDLLADEDIDILDCTPSHAELLVYADAFARVPRALRVIVAGEAISDDLWRKLSTGPWRTFNVYGPTETNNATGRLITSDTSPTIGRPLPGYQVYVVDEALRPVPMGVPGELLVGESALARGYLGRPQQTADRFVPDSLSGRVGERLYRTGDQVRLRPDGELAFLGRSDHQVKIRGFRIELSEVQAALTDIPGIAGCAAVVREDTPGDRRLVCYFTAENGGAAVDDILLNLRNWLPEYMIPAALVELDALPLTANGKIDTRALPAPSSRGVEPDGATPPIDAVEELLVEIWSEVLGTRVGVTDSFFALGGHSLLAARLLVRINKLLAVSLPLRTLYLDPAPRGVAAALAKLAPRRYLDERAGAALEFLRMTDDEVRRMLTHERTN
ncbi:amino acid adenylation domain-containing protein [Nocardiopsis sp. NPDC049922]|uniref:amino acid adenylation domain-containing protein n=1 Tax=Nocardiopsis sp. NPDC049922 TaxID=3155157 RepID=UPI0033D56406